MLAGSTAVVRLVGALHDVLRGLGTTDVTWQTRHTRSVGADAFIVESAPTCYDETWVIDAALSANLPEGVAFQGDAWSLCFDSRGIASSQLTITLANDDGEDRRLEILRGGILRVVE